MRYMYYCGQCGFLASDEGEYSAATCPKCGNTLFATYLPKDQWSLKNDEEKNQLKEKWRTEIQQNEEKAEYVFSQNGDFYEYDVITILNETRGRIDTNKMRTVITQKAKQGWRLHTVYSNELGKNAILGLNSTACEDVLIFERKVKTNDM